jgi:hypothetical protein
LIVTFARDSAPLPPARPLLDPPQQLQADQHSVEAAIQQGNDRQRADEARRRH